MECLEAMASGLYSELFTLLVSLINRLVTTLPEMEGDDAWTPLQLASLFRVCCLVLVVLLSFCCCWLSSCVCVCQGSEVQPALSVLPAHRGHPGLSEPSLGQAGARSHL